MLKSIRSRLMLSHVIVILIAMGISGFVLISFLETYFLQISEDNLAAQASITVQTLIPNASLSLAQSQNISDVASNQVMNSISQQNIYVQSENLVPSSADLSQLANASLQIGTQLNTRIRIVDQQGVLLLDSQNDGSTLNADEQTFIFRQITGDYLVRVKDDHLMELAMPIRVESQQVGTVLLSQPLTEVHTVLNVMRGAWLLSISVAGVLASVIGLLLAQAITNPLRQLTHAVSAVSDGKYTQQVPARSDGELGRLARTFNEMTRRLQTVRQTQIDFVANVSHELRTPLTSIKGMIETLQDGAVDDMSVRDSFLGTLASETNRMIRLVNDLLILSRADSEVLNLRYQSIDLLQLINSTVQQMVVPDDRVVIRSSQQTIIVEVDVDRLRQVLVNLLDNALKYSKDTVEVAVTRSTRHGETKIAVCDQGIGIPETELPKIGQRFYRTDRARSRSQGGSGLGLAIAQALVSAHGGRLWINSKESEGTRIYFTIP